MLEARWENFVSRKNIDWKCLQLEKKIAVSLNAQREVLSNELRPMQSQRKVKSLCLRQKQDELTKIKEKSFARL